MSEQDCDHNIETVTKRVNLPVQAEINGAYRHRDDIEIQVAIMWCTECDEEPDVLIPEGITVSQVKDAVEAKDLLFR